MKILITGSRGFIGSAFKERLRAEGYQVVEFDLQTGHDVHDPDQLRQALEDCAVAYHFAAMSDLNQAEEDPQGCLRSNISGTRNVAEICSECGCLLNYISTSCVYGNQSVYPVTEASVPDPTEIYADSKLSGEKCVLEVHAATGLKYNILRIATVYGPGMRDALVIKIFFDRARAGLPLEVHGHGKQTCSMTYIDDLIDGLLLVKQKGLVNETINLTTEEEVSVNDIADRIIRLTASRSPVIFVPDRKGQIYKRSFDAGKAKERLGWQAKTSLQEGLRKTHAWIQRSSPRVSVVIPVYNGERYLAEALDSVLAQEQPAFEVIVVDDGSKDGTRNIAWSYKDVRYIYQENQGQTAALNTGLEHAAGELIAFLDSDDLWTKSKLRQQVDYLMTNPEVDIVIGQMRNFSDQGCEMPQGGKKLTGIGTMLIRSKVFERIGGFDPDYVHGKAVDWIFRAKEAGVSIRVLPDVIMYRRIHDANQSKKRENKTRDLLKLVKASIGRRQGVNVQG